jgi:hypothetical protein
MAFAEKCNNQCNFLYVGFRRETDWSLAGQVHFQSYRTTGAIQWMVGIHVHKVKISFTYFLQEALSI